MSHFPSAGVPARDAFERLLNSVRTRTGLSFSARDEDHTRNLIHRVMRRLGLDSLKVFADRIATDEDTFDELIAELTVGETYFFRDPRQFEFIRDELLPDVRRNRGDRHHFRAWSAGCASGEEAYSLAMLLLDCGLKDRFTVLGTDICRASLRRARRAEYRHWSLRGGFPRLLARHLQPSESGGRLEKSLRDRVSFEYLNLAHDSYPSFATGTWGMDVILCRNVLIYFEPRIIADLAARFFQCLSPGGVLLTGPSDPLLAEFARFDVETTEAGIVLRRPAGQLSAIKPRSQTNRLHGRADDVFSEVAAPRPRSPADDNLNERLNHHARPGADKAGFDPDESRTGSGRPPARRSNASDLHPAARRSQPSTGEKRSPAASQSSAENRSPAPEPAPDRPASEKQWHRAAEHDTATEAWQASETMPSENPPSTGNHSAEDSRDSRLLQAEELLAEGACEKVVDLLASETGSEAAVLTVRALANRDLEAAEARCSMSLDECPLCAELHYLHAVLLLELGRLAEAAAAVRRVLFIEPELAIAHLIQGTICSRAGTRQAALRAFRNAYRLTSSMNAEEVVQFSDGELAGHLAENALQQLRLLDPAS